jgi:hypothetical protein
MSEALYALLPAVYRVRDAEHGFVLRALFGILETEHAALERDIEALHENWFIETCAEWVVPYIGDLLKAPGLHAGGVGSFSLRAYVANVLAARRRKGTAAVLEQIAGDVSGWRARVVEFGLPLAAAQHLNHVRRRHPAFVSVRDADALALLDSPFDTAAHRVEVRHADTGRGRHNIPHIGVFLWRLQSYEVERGTARALGTAGRHTFHPLGLETPLFNNPRPETEISQIAGELNVPAPLRRRPLYRELEARRAALAADAEPRPQYFGEQPPFRVFLDGAASAVPPESIAVCDLDGWESWSAAPPAAAGIAAIVDPERGRLALPAGSTASRVEVSYAYGFSADVGGGPYNRNESLAGVLGDDETIETIWWRGVSASAGTAAGPVYAGLGAAVQAWNEWSVDNQRTVGVIMLLDSATYEESLTNLSKIELHDGNRLVIVAARWRAGELPSAADPEFDFDHVRVPQSDLTRLFHAEGLRPCLRGNVSVKGNPSAAYPGETSLHLNGLLIDGQIGVLVGDLGALELAHCTVVPPSGRITVKASAATENDNARLNLRLIRAISGALVVPETSREVRIVDSIVDAGAGYALSGKADGSEHAAPARIERSTLRGQVRTKTLELASESLFTDRVRATRLQAGCTRYCYLPQGSEVPHRFRCQPETALLQRARELSEEPSLASDADLSGDERDRIVARMRPMFTSLDYGDAGYMQLASACAAELRTGAENGSEMGAFSHLMQPQREANIRVSLGEYLRFGLEAGIFLVN